MLHIILLIVKTLGIILAIVLFILLCIIGVILFHPVRYSARLEKDKEILINCKAWWLLRIVYIKIMYKENEFKIIFKLFGLTVYDNKKIVSEKKIARKIKKAEAKALKEVKNDLRNKRTKEKKVKTIKEKPQDTIYETKKNQNKATKVQVRNQLKNDKRFNNDVIKNELNIEILQENKENSTYRKAVKTIKYVSKFKDNLKSLYLNFTNKLKTILSTLSNGKKIFTRLLSFLRDDINKRALVLSFQSVVKMIKHILPRRIKGVVRFGTNDPCLTGQLLGVISMAYPIHKGKIKIIPDFENEILEGKILIKGRIRFITLLIIGIKLFLDNKFKQLIKNFKEFKEEL